MELERRLRLVIDTNVLISQAIKTDSPPAKAMDKAIAIANLLFSDETLAEFEEVFLRRKFDKYLSFAQRHSSFSYLQSLAVIVPIPSPIHACRDPRDDKFLEVAVHGRADAILTGDADLLALHPFQGIDILTPADFLQSK